MSEKILNKSSSKFIEKKTSHELLLKSIQFDSAEAKSLISLMIDDSKLHSQIFQSFVNYQTAFILHDVLKVKHITFNESLNYMKFGPFDDYHIFL